MGHKLFIGSHLGVTSGILRAGELIGELENIRFADPDTVSLISRTTMMDGVNIGYKHIAFHSVNGTAVSIHAPTSTSWDITRYDANLQIVNAKNGTKFSSNNIANGRVAIHEASGDYYAVLPVTLAEPGGGGSFVIFKYSSTDSFLWGKTTQDYFVPILVGANQTTGGIVIRPVNIGTGIPSLVSLDSSGNEVYSMEIIPGSAYTMRDGAVDGSSGAAYVTGVIEHALDFSLVKVDASGEIEWTRMLRSVDDTRNLEGRRIEVDQDTGVVYVASPSLLHPAFGSPRRRNIFLHAYASNGDLLWRSTAAFPGRDTNIPVAGIEANTGSEFLYVYGESILKIRKSDGVSEAAGLNYGDTYSDTHDRHTNVVFRPNSDDLFVTGRLLGLNQFAVYDTDTNEYEIEFQSLTDLSTYIYDIYVYPDTSQYLVLYAEGRAPEHLKLSRYTHSHEHLWTATVDTYHLTAGDNTDGNYAVHRGRLRVHLESGEIFVMMSRRELDFSCRVYLSNGEHSRLVFPDSSGMHSAVELDSSGNIYALRTGFGQYTVTKHDPDGVSLDTASFDDTTGMGTIEHSKLVQIGGNKYFVFLTKSIAGRAGAVDVTTSTFSELWQYDLAPTLGVDRTVGMFVDETEGRVYMLSRSTSDDLLRFFYIDIATGTAGPTPSFTIPIPQTSIVVNHNCFRPDTQEGIVYMAGLVAGTQILGAYNYRDPEMVFLHDSPPITSVYHFDIWKSDYPISDLLFRLSAPTNLQSIAVSNHKALVGWDWEAD